MTKSNPDYELSKLARSLANSAKIYSDAFANIKKQTAGVDLITRTVNRQLELERNLLGSTKSFLNQITQLERMSPSIDSIVSANSSFARMVERISFENSPVSRFIEEQKRMQDMIKGIGLADSVTVAFARMDMTRMLSTSLAAQTKLAHIDNLVFGRAAGLDTTFAKSLTVNLGNLTRSYQALIDVAATRDSLAESLPFITTYSPVEYYREVEVLETITTDDINEEMDESIDDAINESISSIDSILANFDQRLCPLLQGARQALQDNNPDRSRHVTTSVRELFTQVLHKLAPDQEVHTWNSNPEFYYNNRPTRRARLLYICRTINCDPLSRFVEDDVRAALSFLDSLNSGTHIVEFKLSQTQLAAIVSRMESLLVFLLQLRNHNNT